MDKVTAKDGETKNRLIKAAREEFISKGYTNASLRNICKNAGVTTGALYFFFKDKDELFGEIVSMPLFEIDRVLTEHQAFEFDTYQDSYDEEESEGPDMDVSILIVEIMFKYKQECILLLTQAAGSKYENIKDKFVSELEAGYKKMGPHLEKLNGYNKVDDYTLHYMTHMQVEAFIYLLTHSKSKEEALKELPYIVKHIRGGWFAVFKS
ncbi:MAG: TetR/AcrR family transcriptional regulator [Saccharofermentans sp.]|nr:TetR/AcrR family transcriptional regulator [Saccharofermentans sp.]